MKKFLLIMLVLALCVMSAAFAEEITGSWATSNPAVVTVDDSGKVTAVGVGEADVSFTDDTGKVTVVHIIVVDLNCPACGVYVDETNAEEHALCLSCGLHACQEGYELLDHETILSRFCNLETQHRVCATDRMHHCEDCGKDYDCSLSGSHTECAMCGLPWCDKTSKGNHATPDCGDDDHRPCQLGKAFDEDDHEWCNFCKKYKCRTDADVKHGKEKGQCGYVKPEETVESEETVKPEPTKEPEPSEKPEVKCSSCGVVLTTVDGHKLTCGTETNPHYSCDGKDHTTKLPCEHLSCASGSGDHNEAFCGVAGHYICDDRSHSSTPLPCGHMPCESGDHDWYNCHKHFKCIDEDNGMHNYCSVCMNCTSDGKEHGEGICQPAETYSTTGFTPRASGTDAAATPTPAPTQAPDAMPTLAPTQAPDAEPTAEAS